ncbi:hypothetical protein BD626DRAFT_9634 [Schizophyllum amplum]|uniref:MYND-type domain-containing protein n=1 Tax=Schizophyllum amplum TaxID=97359 RepID=A0A550CWY6_9AGAR|nr:hypothetical protein BD626DRAFT_9634 [Auriculariopsis ampla]
MLRMRCTGTEYAAKYLAKTIFRWRRNPDVMSAPPFLLSEISSCAYFTRLLLLPDNQDLVVMQVKRTLAAAPTIHYRDPEDFDRILHFLSTLLCVQGIGGISDADKNALVLVLRTWERKYPVGLKKNIATRCVVLLTGTPTLEFDRLMTMRGVALKGVEVCAGELCTRSAENGEPLLRCSRCKSAVYCRQEHQKAHWKKHKSLCFKVEY